MELFGILCFIISRQNKTQLTRKKKICAARGEGAVTDWMCEKRFMKFHAGDFSPDDVPWLGRPVEVDSNQIQTLTENNQHYTTWEIADILKTPKLTNLLVKMQSFFYFMEKY